MRKILKDPDFRATLAGLLLFIVVYIGSLFNPNSEVAKISEQPFHTQVSVFIIILIMYAVSYFSVAWIQRKL